MAMTLGNQPIDPMLKLFVEITEMSPDRRVKHYLEILLVKKETRLRFQIFGNLAIVQDVIELPNGIRLEPQPTHREFTKRISQMTVEEIRQQFTEKVYVIDGWVDSDVWKTGEINERVTNIVEQIERIVALLSFLTGAKLEWQPAQLVLNKTSITVLAPLPIKPRDYIHADKGHIELMASLARLLESLPDKTRIDSYRAMDWYQQGIKSTSPFNSFLDFWLAIETMAKSLYPKLHDKTGKTQIKHAFELVFGKAAAKLRVELCCGKHVPGRVDVDQHETYNESFIDIRNDITHGNISEADTDQKHRVEARLLEIQKLAKEFLVRTLAIKASQWKTKSNREITI
jgi:hypothetical protein